jgi:SPP1 gp7 family putative phage head morphogenesis protein
MPNFNHETTYRREVWKHYNRIGKVIQSIISFHVRADGSIDNPEQLTADLEKYGQTLGTWANVYWSALLQRQNKALSADWKRQGLTIDPHSPVIQNKIRTLLAQQVDLIVTLPRDAATVAQTMAHKAAMETGERAETLIQKLQGLQTGYPEYAARRLARTEVAKTQSLLVQAQAQSLGIKQYIWKTVKDEAVRDSHAAMDGKICDFDNPPEVESGKFYNAGQIHNCRCFAFPLLPRDAKKYEH